MWALCQRFVQTKPDKEIQQGGEQGAVSLRFSKKEGTFNLGHAARLERQQHRHNHQ